jgi:TldD protein
LNAVVKDDSLNIARELILRPGGLDDARLDAALSQVMSSSVDAADLYFQLSREESWALEDGIVKEGSASIEQGVGVRALAGEKTGFAYSDEIVMPALEEASRAARAIAARGSERAPHGVCRPPVTSSIYPSTRYRASRSSEKVAWLGTRRSRDPQDGSARRAGHGERGGGARSRAGRKSARAPGLPDVRPLVRFNVSVIVEQDGRREQGYAEARAGASRCPSW